MDVKLTLKLDARIIERAKSFAKNRSTSLSSLIESYLAKITEQGVPGEKITPLVRSLSGVLNLPEDYDHKKDYTNYLLNKYK